MYSKPKIYNLVMASNATEYSQAIAEKSVKKIVIRSRGINDMLLAYASGETATAYWTIAAGSSWAIDSVWLRTPTLYLKSAGNNDTAEIMIFSDYAA